MSFIHNESANTWSGLDLAIVAGVLALVILMVGIFVYTGPALDPMSIVGP